MAGVRRFEELRMWQASRRLANLIYQLTGQATFRDGLLRNQMRRAAVSVMSNIMEDETYLMALGNYRPLEDAMRIASRELIRWMVEDYGLSALDAYELLSVAMESNVSQLVDPNYSVLVKIRKEYLPAKKNQ